MGMDPTHAADWTARLERMMEQYREASKRRQLEHAMKLWRTHEAREALAALERPPERVH
jgi:hypothetical protein